MTIKNIPVGYKDSPLGIIPMEWEVKRLGEIGTFYGGGTPSKSIDEYWHGDIPWISSADLIENDIYWCNINRFITLEAVRNSSTQIIPQNSILIVTRVGVGKVAVAPCDLCVSQDYICLQNSGMNTIFLAYEIMQRMKNIVSQIQGTSIKGISINEVKKIQLPLPPLAEQEKIAEILSTWDKAIEKQIQLIQKLELRKKGLMQQLITGKKRLPGFTGEWEKVNYNNILREVHRSLKWDDSELYDLISVRRRSGGAFHRESLYGYEIKTKSLRPALKGDFLISKMQIVHGASGVVPEYLSGMKISGSYIALIAEDPKVLNINYFNLWSQMPLFYHQTFVSSYGVHIEKMTFDLDAFMSLSMNLPPIKEQNKIVEVISTATDEVELAKEKLEWLRRQKRGLMQQLLTGKKRVKY